MFRHIYQHESQLEKCLIYVRLELQMMLCVEYAPSPPIKTIVFLEIRHTWTSLSYSPYRQQGGNTTRFHVSSFVIFKYFL